MAEETEGNDKEHRLPFLIFRGRVSDLVQEMRSGAAFPVEGHIELARAWNTIARNALDKREGLFREYNELYTTRYLRDAPTVLGASLAKGMGFRSERYDIDIGGNPGPNSYYVLEP